MINKKEASTLWLVAILSLAILIWVKGGWFHLELLPVSEHVRERGLLTVFDWQIFDINAARLRPISDFFEVIDALLKPKFVAIFGHHPSMMLTSVLIAIASLLFFYFSLRLRGQTRSEAMIFTAFLISTIGFLSCFVPYIRPAKRLVLLALCSLIYLVRISGQRDHPFQANDRSFQNERDRLFQIQRDRFCAFL